MVNPRHDSRWQRFWQLDPSVRRLLLSAVLALGFARAALVTQSFRKLIDSLHREPGFAALDPDPEIVQRIGRAVAVAANNVPWRSDCFPQAIAACRLLSRHGYQSEIHLGVDKVAGEELAGHAWISCGDIVVAGDNNLDRYTIIYSVIC